MWIAAQLTSAQLHVWIENGDQTACRSAPRDPALNFDDQLAQLIAPAIPPETSALVVVAGHPAAPQTPVPAKPDGPVQVNSAQARFSIHAVPWLVQQTPAGVLDGAEPVIAGFIAARPEWDGVLCITGASTRWVHISAGEVVSLQTFATGEMFAYATSAAAHPDDWTASVFAQAVGDAMSRPERAASVLSRARASAQITSAQNGSSTAEISGTLIGSELAATRAYWLGQNLAIIGKGAIAECYETALAAQGAMLERHDKDALCLAGLRQAYAAIRRN